MFFSLYLIMTLIIFLALALTVTGEATTMSMSTSTISASISTTSAEDDEAIGNNINETHCLIFLEEFNQEAMEIYYYSSLKSWTYNTNITDYNQEQMVKAGLLVSNFSREMRKRALEYNSTNFKDSTKDLLGKILFIGNSALKNVSDIEEGANLVAGMKGRYSSGRPCTEDGTCYSLNPGLANMMAYSRNYSELYWAWDAWRDTVGAPSRQSFARYVELKNKVAVANGFPEAGSYWRASYEEEGEDLVEIIGHMYQQMRPLYENLHAYVRRKLYNLYGPDYINLRGPIPAHVLGNMWAQQWTYLNDICEPFPNKSRVDVTQSMRRKNMTVLQMFELAEEFFVSLDMIPTPPSFWNNSMFVRPQDGRKVNCHPSAWDLHNGEDFRIKMCTNVHMRDLITVHHEMGHIQYDLQYKDQHVLHRGGANPAFHEAVGDIMSLSVSTPRHLHTIGLLDVLEEDEEADLNFLMRTALQKVAFLPFAYMMDRWRWDVFSGVTPESKYNEDWWKLRLKYQGIIPPTKRTEEDFDPAAKYHISAGVPYIRYFVSYVIQFQFHDALCKAAGHVGPLYKCDIYESKEAGALLSNMLRKGSSEPWPKAMEAISGSPHMNATAMLSYFQPLMEYLQQENQRNGDIIGWPEMYTPADPYGRTGGGTTFSPAIAATLWTMMFAFFLT